MIQRFSFLLIGWCFCITLVHCKKKSHILDTAILNKEKCYLVFRGTNTKEGLVSKEYNIGNDKPTHVGICIFQDAQWVVYHVMSPREKNSTALFDENLEIFLDVDKQSIYNASIWAIDNLRDHEIQKLKRILRKYKQIHLNFDLTFKSKDTTNIYCSKFVNTVLMNATNRKFNFKPIKAKLKPLHSIYLAQDSLEYYPVDLFQLDEHISLLHEWTFE